MIHNDETPIYNEVVRKKIVDGALCVVFLFSAYDKKDSYDDKFNFYSYLIKLNCSVVLLRDVNCSWYHTPHPNKNVEFDDICSDLIKIKQMHRRSICVGSSMGGTGALYWGSILGVDSILAFAPFVTTTLDGLKLIGDGRFSEDFNRISEYRRDRLQFDASNLDTSSVGRIYIIIGSNDPLDVKHAHLVSHNPKVTIHVVDGFGHGIIAAVSRSNMLDTMIDNLMNIGEVRDFELVDAALYNLRDQFNHIVYAQKCYADFYESERIVVPAILFNSSNAIWGGGTINLRVVSRIRQVGSWREISFYSRHLGEVNIHPQEWLGIDIIHNTKEMTLGTDYEVDLELWIGSIPLEDLGFSRMKLLLNPASGFKHLSPGLISDSRHHDSIFFDALTPHPPTEWTRRYSGGLIIDKSRLNIAGAGNVGRAIYLNNVGNESMIESRPLGVGGGLHVLIMVIIAHHDVEIEISYPSDKGGGDLVKVRSISSGDSVKELAIPFYINEAHSEVVLSVKSLGEGSVFIYSCRIESIIRVN